MPRVAVAGVSGYAGAELARVLLHHPRFPEPPLFLGREREHSNQPTSLAQLHPQLASASGRSDLVHPFHWDLLREHGVNVLLLATPHEQSRAWVPTALERGMRVVDLSGAWRLHEAENRAVYQLTDADPTVSEKLQVESVYGSPELHREQIMTARLVANPGCYATSIILALAPLLQADLIDLHRGIVCDAKSGVSGAGKASTAKTHFMYAADNLSAYSVFGHRHTGELLEQLHLTSGQIRFTPHLLPIPRGILSTLYVRLKEPSDRHSVTRIFEDFFQNSPLVRVHPPGHLPQIQHVVRSNFCDIGVELSPDGRDLLIVSCLDNLLKGAAGQAVQNLNLMCGWAETEGLL
jgi:N-acetyl-gamma-glutamyl-phosphate reductase